MACSTGEDSLIHMLERWSISKDQKATFRDDLAAFPHSFQMQNQEQLSTSQVKSLTSGLESALKVGHKTRMETARARNLLAYALYQLGRPEDAVEMLNRVLRMEDQAENLVTLANKAFILFHQHRPSCAAKQLNRLRQLQTEAADFQYLVVQAKAELAFSYTRLGPSFSEHAVSSFNDVLPSAREPERWLWSFGLTLTKRRALNFNLQSASCAPSKDFQSEVEDILKAYLEIIDNCSCTNLKAKAYAELATALFNTCRTNIKKECVDVAGMSIEDACKKAIELDRNDNSVLLKCGTVYRRIGKQEVAQEHLERALSIRPSSRGNFHVGNIYLYKAIRMEDDKKDQDNTAQNSQKLLEKEWEHCGSEDPHSPGPDIKMTLEESEQHAASPVSDIQSSAGGTVHDLPLGQSGKATSMQKVIKSPGKMTRLSTDDRNVKKARENFEEAIRISEGENIEARYELALLQRRVGELHQSKLTLMGILNDPQTKLFRFSTEVKVYEQMGQVCLELADKEKNEEENKDFKEDGKSHLLVALQKASRIFSEYPGIKERPGELFVSVKILLEKATTSGKGEKRELQEKAQLYKLINENKHSLKLLQELERLDPEIANDENHMKNYIENYVALEQYEDAASVIELLKCTTQTSLPLFEDKQYVLKIYLKAARQALLKKSALPASAVPATTIPATTIPLLKRSQGATSPVAATSTSAPITCKIASAYFRSAFREFLTSSRPGETGHAASGSSVPVAAAAAAAAAASPPLGKAGDTWDVVVVHEEWARAQARTVEDVLQNVCGLKVAVMDRDVPPNMPELDGELHVLCNTSVVVVLLAKAELSGKTRFLSENADAAALSGKTQFLVENAAMKWPTVSVVLEGGEVPPLLNARRSLRCSGSLLDSLRSVVGGQVTQSRMDAICYLLDFLFNVSSGGVRGTTTTTDDWQQQRQQQRQ